MNGDIRVPQTVINQFIYAGNNPVMFTDPSGAFIAALIGLIYEAIAAAISAIYTYIANLMSAIMTADWKGIYDGITSFAGLKDQALGAGRESLMSGAKEALGVADTFGGKSLGDFAKSQLNMDLGLPSIPAPNIAPGVRVVGFQWCKRPLNGFGGIQFDKFEHDYFKYDDGSTISYGPEQGLFGAGKVNRSDSGGNCGLRVNTSAAQDQAMKDWANKNQGSKYHPTKHNCRDFLEEVIRNGIIGH